MAGLFDDAMFAPQMGGGILGRLKEILQMAQVNPVQSQGFPQNDAQLPVNAQPTQGIMPPMPMRGGANAMPVGAMPEQIGQPYSLGPAPFQQMPQGMPQTQPQMQPQMPGAQSQQQSTPFFGSGGSLQSGLYDLAGILNPQLKGLGQGAQAQQYLTAHGMNPAMARIVANNPTLLAGVVGNQLGMKDRTDDIKEFEYAKSQGFKGGLQEWMAAKRGGAGEYSLNPIYGTGPDGKPIVMQLGKSGTAVQSKLPDGVNISTGVDKIDLGTQWGLLDKRSGQIVGYAPKDLQGAERAKAVGEGQGKAAVTIPAAETTVNNAVSTIDKLRNHPGLDVATGATGVIARKIPGTEAYNFDALNKQAQGQAFMSAREALKGAGQVTDFEGRKGEQAIANLDAAQSKKQYLDALGALERMMKQSLADLKTKSGASPATSVPSISAPMAGNDPLGLR